MGKFGSFLGREVGGWLGRRAVQAAGGDSRHDACASQLGSAAGESVGKYIPFKKGGRVRKNTRALLHKGEYVLPKGVPPTKKQIMAVKKKGGK
tara:strand:+ start:420 stop:698 length:279 start_codon:yes stop_codon:yes gene_type:complete